MNKILQSVSAVSTSFDFPSTRYSMIDEGFGISCKFNRWGTLLAIGCRDGRILIWDAETYSIAQVFTGHTQPVTSLGWSKCGRMLASSSVDRTVIVWDVKMGIPMITEFFDTPAWNAEFFFFNGQYHILVSLTHEIPYVITVDWDRRATVDRRILPIKETIDEYVNDNEGDQSQPQKHEDESFEISCKTYAPMMKIGRYTHASIIACYDRMQNRIFAGTSKGLVYVVDMNTWSVATVKKVSSNVPCGIHSISFNKKYDMFLLNCGDKAIRLYDTDVINEKDEVLRHRMELMDFVTKLSWRKCIFSPNSDYIVSGSWGSEEHCLCNLFINIISRQFMFIIIYIFKAIWETTSPKIMKQDLPDKLVDIDWHPTNPVIAICGSNGCTNIWVSKMAENWSTYAPKFKELQSNVEYVEREDEFDYKGDDDDDDDDDENDAEVCGNDGLPPKKRGKRDVALRDRMEIDILTVDPNSLDDDDGYNDTPEEKRNFLKHLPIDLKPDVKIEVKL